MAAAILFVLAPAILATSPDEFDAALEPVAAAAGARRRQLGRDPLRDLPLPAVLRQQMRSPMLHARLARHVHGRAPAECWPPGAIPEVLPDRFYRPALASLLLGTFPWTGRRFCALAAARVAGAATWTSAAASIGTDLDLGRLLASTIPKRIPDPEAFWLAIEAAAEALRCDGADYPSRRQQVTLTCVSAHWVTDALPDGSQWTPERARHAATFLWSEWAGGDYRSSPAMTDTAWAASMDSRRQGWRCWTRWADAALETALLTQAEQIVGARERR